MHGSRSISWDEPLATFKGCDEKLLGGARMLYMISYVVIIASVCSLCAFCVVVVKSLAQAVEDAEQNGMAWSPGGTPRSPREVPVSML